MKSHHLFLAASIYVAPHLPIGPGLVIAAALLIPGIALFVLEFLLYIKVTKPA